MDIMPGKKKFSFLCLMSLGFCQMDLEDYSRLTFAVPKALTKLQEFIALVDDDRQHGYNMREAVPLTPPRPDYNIQDTEVSYYLPHSVLSFCSQGLVDSKLCYCEGKFKDTKVIENQEYESRVTVAADTHNKLIVVSYRLSVTPKNWDLNEDHLLVSHPFPDGEEKVHKGHLAFFKSLQNKTNARVLGMLNNPKYQDYTLHVTGYSLGGTVAIIAMPSFVALFKKHNLKNKYRVFAYSSSRPGNLEFAQYLENLNFPIIRYTRKGDITPLLPDQAQGYSQVGQEFYDQEMVLNPNNRLKTCSQEYIEDKRCSLGDTIFFSPVHLLPYGKPIPLPPFC
ncbi:hypothetical protein DSO57_1014167 [Entomophthora muscae]|uniref:Uncharacterized protein n=1 Tax=Entomophthora muscae TaxID=34485 RepID=A0ACC2TT60_9FUNG|nr:hypothetical protein DSO57_1014167 [Entomophthora muscae]